MRRTRATSSGFTLIETALAVVIIGVGVIAMVDAQRAFMQSNAWSNHAATATYLANEIREMTPALPSPRFRDGALPRWRDHHGVGTRGRRDPRYRP